MAAREPRLIRKIAELREALTLIRRERKRVGFVPTMGALHEGHLSLVRACKTECDCTVVSIFVNPTQFGPQEDFERYPRTLDRDLAGLRSCGVELVFAPEAREMYPPGFDTWVEVKGVSEPLEGVCRPGHFRGVATVVLKLFNIVQPDVAYFGQKDYQQALVIEKMIRDLDLPIILRVLPTVRESDGLAMSSRNSYLDPESRKQATVLWRSLCRAAECLRNGERRADVILREMRQVIDAIPNARTDYVALVNPETLQPVDAITGKTLAAVAVRLGKTRLIDNLLLEP